MKPNGSRCSGVFGARFSGDLPATLARPSPPWCVRRERVPLYAHRERPAYLRSDGRSFTYPFERGTEMLLKNKTAVIYGARAPLSRDCCAMAFRNGTRCGHTLPADEDGLLSGLQIDSSSVAQAHALRRSARWFHGSC